MTVVDLPYPFSPDEEAGVIAPFDQVAVNAYRNAGWKNLIPLPYGKQSPPPKGFTGRNCERAKVQQLKDWIVAARSPKDAKGRAKAPTANIALVHGELTIAIDVDDYEIEGKRKNGGESLRALEEMLGPLPATWRSSARGFENPSGQRFYRLKPEQSPQLLDWDDKPGPHIEIVRWGHRYSVVWPSMNGRLGSVYRWYQDDGPGAVGSDEHFGWEAMAGQVPPVDDLPYLPDAWVEYLTRGFTEYDDKLSAREDLSDDSAREWVLSMPKSDGPPCARMQSALDEGVSGLGDGAHDTARDKLMHMLLLAWEGHTGLNTASLALRDAFFEEVSGRRGHGAARGEWYRNYKGAVDRVAARGTPIASACACWESAGTATGAGANGGDPAAYETNDDGNAEHLHALVGEDMIWVEGHKSWMIWHEENSVWTPDAHNAATARARLVGPRVKAAAAQLYDVADTMEDDSPEQKRTRRKALRLEEWGRTSGMVGRLSGMLSVMKSREGVTIPMNDFDARPDLLVCKGTTIELLPRGSGGSGGDEGIRVRESQRTDYALHTTNLEYVPWAEIKRGGEGSGLVRGRRAWESYLDTFLPDPEVRWYVQRLLGYALYGANPERKIVFFQGKTSTGKSTILEAVSAALGRYAGPFNLSMFRENPNESPRPDIVEALPKRIIVATEADAEWHLHADTIKRLVGGIDQAKVRNLFSNEYMIRYPAFVPFVGTNSSPTIQGADSALWQRIIVVPFEIQRLDDDKRTDKMASIRLMSELDSRMSVLSWLVDGYVGYAREGLSSGIPAGITGATKGFRAGVSEWHSFMNEAVEPQPGFRILVQDLYQMYRVWGMMNDIPDRSMGTKKQFDHRLESNGYPVRRMKKPGSQNKANYLMDYKMKPGPDEDEAASSAAETVRGSEGSVDPGSWSPSRYAEIQGSEED